LLAETHIKQLNGCWHGLGQWWANYDLLAKSLGDPCLGTCLVFNIVNNGFLP